MGDLFWGIYIQNCTELWTDGRTDEAVKKIALLLETFGESFQVLEYASFRSDTKSRDPRPPFAPLWEWHHDRQ